MGGMVTSDRRNDRIAGSSCGVRPAKECDALKARGEHVTAESDQPKLVPAGKPVGETSAVPVGTSTGTRAIGDVNVRTSTAIGNGRNVNNGVSTQPLD